MAVSTSSKHITTYGPTGTYCYYCKFLGFFIGVVKHGSAQHESTYTATTLGMLFLCRQWDGKLGSESTRF